MYIQRRTFKKVAWGSEIKNPLMAMFSPATIYFRSVFGVLVSKKYLDILLQTEIAKRFHVPEIKKKCLEFLSCKTFSRRSDFFS